MEAGTTRYSCISIALHWVMALAFFLMLGSGVAMEYFIEDKALKFDLFQWHKSGGVLLLIAFFLRISWRLKAGAPALPDAFPSHEKRFAKIGHWGLYAIMFALPFTGWVMVSSSVYGLPTIVFGWFEWPHIPGIAANHAIEERAELAHLVLAITFGALIIAHIAAVVKHRVKDHINLLPRMGIGKGNS